MTDFIDVIVPRGGTLADRARAAREPHAGDRASRRHLPRLCRRAADLDEGARRSCSTPRCAAPASAARPRRCWSTARSPTTHLPPILAELHRSRLRGARRRRRCARSIRTREARDRAGLAHRISRRDPRGARGRRTSTARSRISTATARTTPTRSSPRTATPPSASSTRSTAPSCCTTPRPSSPTAASSAWAPRSASRTGRLHAARAGRRRAAHELQIRRARQRPGAALSPRRSDARRSRDRARRIGLLGGSFNPAHDGHRHISLEALKRLGLDEVWWLVSPQNPLKPARRHGAARQAPRRRRAPSRASRASASLDLEARLGTRYTARHARRAAPRCSRARASSG